MSTPDGANPWIIASRPHTLPAAASPVIIGAALAYANGLYSTRSTLAALLGALLIQVGTNFANDYYDAEKGVDEADREGFTRVTASGLLSPDKVWRGMMVSFGLAVLVGVYLVYLGGVPILAVGLSGILLGITYAGGPLPFGSIGLGDLMVFLYFGIIPVAGTYYVNACQWTGGRFPTGVPAGTLPVEALVAGIPPACWSTAILVVNNLRDLDSDRAAGKRTLATIIGRTGSRIEYSLLSFTSYAILLWFYPSSWFSPWVWLPFLTVPFTLMVNGTVWRHDDGSYLNPALSRTGQVLFLYSVLFSMGMIL